MKTQTAYIAKISDEGVFVSLKPKPDANNYIIWDDSLIAIAQTGCRQVDGFDEDSYKIALKKWEDNLIRAENAHISPAGYAYVLFAEYGDPFTIKLSQQVEIQLTQEGCKIVKI